MKNKIAFMMLIVFSLSLTSCDKDEIKKPNEKIIDGINVDLNASRLGDTFPLVEYSNMQELQDKIPNVISNLLDEMQVEKSQNSQITDVSINLKFSNGKVYLSEVVFYDSINDLIVNGYILNFNTLKYESAGRSDIGFLLVGGCPVGYTSLGTCSNFDDPKACVTNKISAFMTANISGYGDCATVQVSVGALATTVCGKKC